MQPRDRLIRYLFVAEQPAFKGEPSESPFLERLGKLSGLLNKGSLIFIPYAGSDEVRRAMNVGSSSEKEGRSKLERLGSVTLDPENEQVTISESDKQLTFDMTETAPIVQSSMNLSYLFRTLRGRGYPGIPISDNEPQTAPIRPRRALRERFSWSGSCATQTMRYASVSTTKTVRNGSRS